MALWDNYDDVAFTVLTNARGQDSLWPAARPRPHGWAAVGFVGSRRECLDEIDRRAAEPDPAADYSGGTVLSPPRGRAVLRGPERAGSERSVTALIRARDLPPDHPALVCGPARMTRGELLDACARWAHRLRAAGAGREVPVAILLPRGLEALVAILAVLEAGAAYVPLSYDDPPERIRSILDDCGAPIVVTTADRAAGLASAAVTVLTVDALAANGPDPAAPPDPAAADDLAYVFYTSGTTGRPKGVEGTHGQLANYALWCRRAFAHRPGEVTFLSASLSFLGSLTTIFTPLLEGWPIVVAADGSTTDDLLGLARGHTGGLLKLTPTHIRMMMARGVPAEGLARQLMVGSEPLTFTAELHEWMAADPERVVVNHYGLTETHGCFCHWLTGKEDIGSRVPIGTPIDNVEAYIVDRNGDPVGVGEVGELLVGGPSLGRGYRRRPALTAERWIAHPWGTDGARLLRTGDLARMDEDGVVTVLGRADRQVKIRGHRVEPAALEEALRGLDRVREALVLPRVTDGAVGLDGYLLVDGPVDLVRVRDELRNRFPPQWIPARMAALTEFPVNANGKVDAAALPEPRPVGRDDANPERWSRLDRRVADAFGEVLRIDDIGLHDSFYDLGGDSLGSVEVAARLGRVLGREVPALSADAATVRAYARRIADAGAG